MNLLLASAFRNPKHYFLIIFSVVAMCFLTFASQLEIVTLGVITKKGPDFFELFSKKGTPVDGVALGTVEAEWHTISGPNSDVITKEDARLYMAKHDKGDFIQKVVAFIEGILPIAGNMRNLAIMVFFVAIFKAITLFAHRFTTRLIAIRVSRDLRQGYFEHIQQLPMEFYQKYNIGALSSRVVSDSAQIAEAINACLVNYLQTPFTLISTLTLCFLTSWQLTIFVFMGFPLIVLPIIFIAHKVKTLSKQLQQNQEQFTSVLLDFLTGIQTVKVFAMENFSLEKYREQNLKMAQLERRSARYDLSSRPVVHSIGMTFLATALMYGLYGLNMSVASVLFYGGLLYIFYEPVKKFAEENSHIQRGVAAAERMYEVMSIKPSIEDEPDAVDFDDFEGTIEFRDVSFRYGTQWVLNKLCFTVNKGETVAIVGPTGAGKSTIVQLLPRLYDVEEGEILVNGKPLKTYTTKSLREKIAFVPQKPFLFQDSIAENINVGRKFNLDQVKEAATQAHADEFICRLPEGYQTQLADSGKNLSGGQQQRLAIARALVTDAPILVLDEATSSLDNISEHHIKSAIHQLRGKKTQIIIAHRLTTIEDADRIVYIEDGRKIAEGTKDELLASCKQFKRMWEIRGK